MERLAMKELGCIVRWGRVVPGREQQAVEMFAETTKFYGELLARGDLTHFEPFVFLTGDGEIDNGFFILKGPAEKITEIFESEEMLRLKARRELVLSHLATELVLVGEEVLNHLARFAETAGRQPVGVA
jgi:hypothetical protein